VGHAASRRATPVTVRPAVIVGQALKGLAYNQPDRLNPAYNAVHSTTINTTMAG
jgi:hypothetical protein